jgi:hypothetical protein
LLDPNQSLQPTLAGYLRNALLATRRQSLGWTAIGKPVGDGADQSPTENSIGSQTLCW